MIFAIYNLSINNVVKDYNNEPRPVISYNFYSNRKLLNDLNNSDFFSIAFSALFFYGNNGYIIPQSTKVFLHAETKWALSHYFRCFT